MTNGIYHIRNAAGEVADGIAVQVLNGQVRGVRRSTKGNWMVRGTFAPLSDAQTAALLGYGMTENQTIIEG